MTDNEGHGPSCTGCQIMGLLAEVEKWKKRHTRALGVAQGMATRVLALERAIENEPHDYECHLKMCDGAPCSCWKSKVLP